MPIGGHPSTRPFGLKVCTPCHAGDHGSCRRIWEPERRRVLFCECPGWTTRGLDLFVLPCLLLEETRDAR